MSEELAVFTDWLFEIWVWQYFRVAALMVIFWGIYLIIKNAALVDFGWVANYLLIGCGLFALVAKTHNYKFYLFFGLLIAWSFRLGGYLLSTRVCRSYKDPRYEKLSENSSNKAVYFFLNYQLQGILATICASTLYFTFRRDDVDNLYTIVIGSVMIAIGIIGEAVADQQLWNYKNRKDKPKGAIFQEGLWKKSRHPNLFFELMVWFGFAVTGINDNGIEALGFIGPIVLWAVMNFLTIPISEKHMYDTRPDYPDFVKNTNKFIPF
mmetsp:Transcript_55987/g.64245  ORF Transcript_55987/g.64245 Transcript_55987/m.64245 type:complete len:266 (+) Transcript_55987:68-865(+)